MPQTGRGGMGSHKHGVSGRSQKSPRLRHHMKLEAERDCRKARRSSCTYASINECLADR
ncbi:MAG: hypothetical protein ACR2PT_20695 [Endozoicomonas sp.]